MREVTAAIREVTGVDPGPPATDGCSAPAYALPLESLARAFARLGTGEGLSLSRATAARRLVNACTAEPFMVAGTGRFDTDAMMLFGKRVFIKSGAEGVFCAAFPDLGFGVAIKCDDGAQRGPETAIAAVIDVFLPMSESERAQFADRLAPPVTTRKGVKVGEMRPVAGLLAALREGRVVS
jgi:L-asparaginase II